MINDKVRKPDLTDTAESNSFYPDRVSSEKIDLKTDLETIIKFIHDNSNNENLSVAANINHGFEVLRSLIWEARDPEDFVKLADIFGQMYVEAKNKIDKYTQIMGPGGFVIAIINAAGSLYTNPKDGRANPELMASLLEPAFERINKNQYINNLSGIIYPPLARHLPNGTADRKTAYLLASRGGFDMPKKAKILEDYYEEGAEYLTMATLNEVGFELKNNGPESIEYATRLMVGRLMKLKNNNNKIATQVLGALEKLNPQTNNIEHRFSYSIQSFIKIANTISDELNKNKNNPKLDRLNEKDLSNLTDAYLRILYVVDKDTLNDAMDDSVEIADSSDTRREMIMIQAYIDNWIDYSKKASETVGEMTMRLIGQEIPMNEIARKVELSLNGARQGAVTNIRQRKHAYWNRRKSGHGLIS